MQQYLPRVQVEDGGVRLGFQTAQCVRKVLGVERAVLGILLCARQARRFGGAGQCLFGVAGRGGFRSAPDQ